jgi:hypothetical protein
LIRNLIFLKMKKSLNRLMLDTVEVRRSGSTGSVESRWYDTFDARCNIIWNKLEFEMIFFVFFWEIELIPRVQFIDFSFFRGDMLQICFRVSKKN